jgi:hypothetical protein
MEYTPSSLFPVPYSLKLKNFVPHDNGKYYNRELKDTPTTAQISF